MAQAASFSPIGLSAVKTLARLAAKRAVQNELRDQGVRVSVFPYAELMRRASEYLDNHPDLYQAALERAKRSRRDFQITSIRTVARCLFAVCLFVGRFRLWAGWGQKLPLASSGVVPRKFCKKFVDPDFTSRAILPNAARPTRVLQMLADLADTIYWFGCIVAAVILALGVAAYWFGQGGLSVLGSWVVLAAIPWAIGSAIRYILTGRL